MPSRSRGQDIVSDHMIYLLIIYFFNRLEFENISSMNQTSVLEEI